MSLQILKVDKNFDNVRVDIFISKILTGIPSRTFVKKLIDDGHVKVNEKIIKPNHKVQQDDDVLVDIPDDFLTSKYIAPEEILLDIFYEDDYLIVINKPTGMTVHPANGCYSGTLVNALLNYSVNLSQVNSDMRPGIVHRLDKETSGLIVVAKDNITHTKLAKQFQRHQVNKKYIALVEGEVEFDEGKIDAPLGPHFKHHEKRAVLFDSSAKEATTTYRVIKRHNGVSLVSLFPKTGRTHQLRVHMAYIGHSILGDDKYGKKNNFNRLALHAQSIGFNHPFQKSYVEFSTKIPGQFLARVDL